MYSGYSPAILPRMNDYHFTLIVLGEEEFEDVIDPLYESGCDDATMCSRDGVMHLIFTRGSTDFETAVLSAIADIETAGPMLRVKGLEPSDLVTLDEIANRLGYSEEYTRKLLTGGIDSLDNPPLPYTNVDYGNTIWSYKDVVSWLYDKEVLEDSDLLDRAVKTFEIEYFLKSRDSNVSAIIERLELKLKDMIERI